MRFKLVSEYQPKGDQPAAIDDRHAPAQRLDFSHVAKITIYTTSISEFRAPDVAQVRAKYFGDNRPASTLVQISQLASPEYKIEIEATAIAP